MKEAQLFDPIKILHGSEQSLVKDAVLINDGHLVAFGDKAREEGKKLGLTPTSSEKNLLAPCLVDPHSILEDPICSKRETLLSLCESAATAGYGHIALLPRSNCFRDRPERLIGFQNKGDVSVHLWGGFSKEGESKELSAHGDLIQNGAIGLAEDDKIPSLDLLQRGLVLKEMGKAPILLAPRNKDLQGNGMVREGVEALRAGWVPDPIASETLPLSQLIELQKQHPECSLRLMNISTSAGVKMLSTQKTKQLATVCWWHLVQDASLLRPTDPGWRICPSLGSKEDRLALIDGLKKKIITAIAVHAIPLDEEDMQHPPNQREPGLAGHHLVLPSIWNELVEKGGISIEDLWKFLSFGPSSFLGLPKEKLTIGSNRWLIFDPNKSWVQRRRSKLTPMAANQPWEGETIKGKVIACGLKA